MASLLTAVVFGLLFPAMDSPVSEQSAQRGNALDAYIAGHPLVSWRVLSTSKKELRIDLASQTWRELDWKHSLVLLNPTTLRHKGIAILAITGGKENAKDLAWAQKIADTSGIPVASLFDVPNQPLWGLLEDDLVAYTFSQYLQSEDSEWPLLFPMANSAIRAMDALQTSTRGTANPLRRFVLTGESKRGWTTWLAGTSRDRRIAGIAPFIYDNLNIAAQLPHQIKTWGHYSPMYKAYKDLGLLEVLETPIGKKLAAMVDPYASIGQIRAPVLNVIGGKDPFWTIDATSQYWSRLSAPKTLVVMPGKAHDFPGDANADRVLSAFAICCAKQKTLPQVRFGAPRSGPVDKSGPAPKNHILWRAVSVSADFSGSTWARVYEGATAPPLSRMTPVGDGSYAAYTLEGRFLVEGIEVGLFSPPRIVSPKRAN